MSEHSVLVQLWVPVAVFTHLFAAIWLIRAFQLMQPAAWATIRSVFRPEKRRKPDSSSVSHGGWPDTSHAPSVSSLNAADLGTSSTHSEDSYPGEHYPAASVGTDPESNSEHHAVALVSAPGTSDTAARCTYAELCNNKSKQHAALQLTWRSIGCTYKTAQGMKTVLLDVWGDAAAGEMQALIGPSGAGKSSLLDILACRKATGSIAGTVLLDGLPVQQTNYTRRIAYVPQDDNFIPVMTCLEVLNFHAAMQLPNSSHKQKDIHLQHIAVQTHTEAEEQRQQQPPREHKCRQNSIGQAKVQSVLRVVGLFQHSTTLVGGRLPGGLLLRGLSSGERRRLSIAVGILADPDILFLDEPTSGLDAFAALSVMTHLQSLAHSSSKAVLAAIHQPRSAIWSLFDKVTLLASGLLMYHGAALGMVPWLSGQLGYSYNPLQHGLASDWALDLVVVEFNKPRAFQARTMTSLAELQTAANTFKLQYICDQLHDEDQQLELRMYNTPAPLVADATAQQHHHLPSGPLSRGGSFEVDHIPPEQRQLDLELQQTGAVKQAQQQESACGAAAAEQLVSCQQDSVDSNCAASAMHTGSRRGIFLPRRNMYRTSLWQQYKALTWRELLKVTRNPADVAGRTLTFTWIALLVGLIYYDMPTDASSIRQRLNLLFATLCFFVLMPFVNMSLYTEDKGAYLADKSAKLYAPSAYYLAKVSVSLPFQVLTALTASMVQYGMTGMRPGADNLFKHCSIGTIMSLIAVQVLHLASTIAPSQDAAFMMGIGWTATNLVMSGFFIPYKEIRFSVLSNLRYVSAMHYAFEGFLQVELGHRLFDCPTQQLDSESATFLTQLLPGAASMVTPEVLQQLAASPEGCVVDSNAVPGYFGLNRDFGTTIAVLLGYLGIVHIWTFLALLLVARKERR